MDSTVYFGVLTNTKTSVYMDIDMKKLLTSLSLGTGALLASAMPAFAAPLGTFCPEGTDFTLLCKLPAGTVIGGIVNLIFIIAIVIAFVFLIIGGFKWVVSGGDKGAVEGARNTIIAAIVGLVILFLAFIILNIVLGLFGTSLNTLNVTPLSDLKGDIVVPRPGAN